MGNGIFVVTRLGNTDKVIAIEEQLYDTITSAHEACGHGGRDATKYKVSNAIRNSIFLQMIRLHMLNA